MRTASRKAGVRGSLRVRQSYKYSGICPSYYGTSSEFRGNYRDYARDLGLLTQAEWLAVFLVLVHNSFRCLVAAICGF